ncbi:MAG: 4Fe-4S dicluster domain-containing protein [Chloroflexota bacterium]
MVTNPEAVTTDQTESHLVNVKWGMVIDLDRCTGCGACVQACRVENNIAIVGEEECGKGRAHYWMRVERYFDGEYPNLRARFMPILCQHCQNAPCEPVCPVYAAYRDRAEQLNAQIYNRCIGTRYCANNCPYYVRFFNWFDYARPEPLREYLNPDVTVRSRGVMEKCTFCIQRIRHARVQALREHGYETDDGIARVEIEDGKVQPACVQTCPTGALVFGDLSQPESRVSILARSERRFKLLEDLGTEPVVIYLKEEH